MKFYRLIKNVLYVVSIILPLYDTIKGMSSGLSKGLKYYGNLRQLKEDEIEVQKIKEALK